MSYYIINVESGKKLRKIVSNAWYDARFDTEKGAKMSLTRMVNSGQLSREQWTVMSYNEHCEKFPVKMVERTNLMSGQKYMEAEDTPNCCSPASERYWSM